MERIYYPSRPKVLRKRYLRSGLYCLLGIGIFMIIAFSQGRTLLGLEWIFFPALWLTQVGTDILKNGFWAEGLAICITPTTISGPLIVGKDKSIRFDEIDYEKTLHTKLYGKELPARGIFRMNGDRIQLYESLFEPEDVAEIRQVLFESERQQGKRTA